MINPLFEKLFIKHENSDRKFLSFRDESFLTYGEFIRMVYKFAVSFRALGLEPGDRVALKLEKNQFFLGVYGACIHQGLIFLPINENYTAEETSFFLRDSQTRLFVTTRKEAESLSESADSYFQIETLENNGTGTLSSFADCQKGPTIPKGRNLQDVAALLYTSGTTGRPKAAMITHENLISNVETLKEYWRFSAEDILIHALPVYHTHGLFVATNVSLISGGSLIFLPKFDLDAIVKYMPKATSLMGVPTFYARFLDDPRFTAASTAHMRLFISGSAPLLTEIHSRFEARTGHRILERYGMTETNMNTSNPYEGDRRAGSVGLPLPGVEVRICDADGHALPQGEIGEVEVRGANVFQGYWQMSEKTAAELRETGFFITGDLGRIDEDGYLYIVGRNKDLIISGGYNIYPKEIELVLDDQPEVLESAVIGVPHPDFGETVLGVIVAKPGQSPDLDAMMDAISSALARFKHPRKLVLLDELPRNTMGKVQKNILRGQYKDMFALT